jgi:hypothetical protein
MSGILCLALGLSVAPGAAEAFWPFTKKKEQTEIYNTPKTKGNPADKKWLAGKVLPSTSAEPDVVINGMTVKGLKPSMMTASYAPKNVEEIGAIAMAHTSWQAGALADLEDAAQARIAAAKMRSQRHLANLQAGKYKRPVSAQAVQGAAGEDAKPPVRQIFNKPVLTKPGKVFTDYR